MISHIILPLCVVPLTFILIPDLKMTDNIQIEHDEHITTGGDDDDGAGGEGGGGDGGGSQGRGLSINANAKKKKKKQKGRASSPTGSDDSQVGLMDGMSSSDGSESDDLDLQRL